MTRNNSVSNISMIQLSRRNMLRGLGTAITLPFLESLLPLKSFGAISDNTIAKLAAGPRRLAWVYVPNGVNVDSWMIKDFGRDYELSPSLSILNAYKERMLVISNLVCDKANQNGDGPGDHARAQSAYLTGCQPRKAEGAGIKAGQSADQAAADRVGHLTKFASLEIGLEEGKQIGSCDNGYSCAYSHNLSWRNEKTPMTKDCNPQTVFDRLFGNFNPNETKESRAIREKDSKSVLDFILNDANKIQKKLNSTDKDKLDQYLTAVRDIELRLDNPINIIPPEGVVRPPSFENTQSGLDYPDRAKLMIDMMVLAFQADLTRIITFPFSDEGSNQQYPWADADVPHHGTSHHGGDPTKLAYLAKINAYHLSLFNYMLDKLDSIKEGDKSILDNSLISYGGGISDGNRHNHDALPIVLLGGAGGKVNTGQHIDAKNIPINNLWLSMLDVIGAEDDKLGDSTGKLKLS